jgi:hypothetical protein
MRTKPSQILFFITNDGFEQQKNRVKKRRFPYMLDGFEQIRFQAGFASSWVSLMYFVWLADCSGN